SLVKAKLLEPLAAKEERQSRFSRAILPPRARRTHVVERQAQKDSKGRSFVTFGVDVLLGWSSSNQGQAPEGAWRPNAITGCVYPDTDEVLVKRGNVYFPVALLLGKKTNAAPEHV